MHGGATYQANGSGGASTSAFDNLYWTDLWPYSGYDNGTCYGSANTQGSVSYPVFTASDAGTWIATRATAPGPAAYGVVCDNAAPLDHALSGTADLGISGSDDLSVQYTLTQAGAVAFKATSASSSDFPGEHVTITGTGYTTGFDRCPRTWFRWNGMLHIVTTG